MQQVGLPFMGLVFKKKMSMTAYKIADFINVHYVNFVWFFSFNIDKTHWSIDVFSFHDAIFRGQRVHLLHIILFNM